MIGGRTLAGLAWSLVPSWTTTAAATLALGVAIAGHAVAAMATAAGWQWAPRIDRLAYAFEVLPIWIIAGASLHQLAARLVQAVRDLKQAAIDAFMDAIPPDGPTPHDLFGRGSQ